MQPILLAKIIYSYHILVCIAAQIYLKHEKVINFCYVSNHASSVNANVHWSAKAECHLLHVNTARRRIFLMAHHEVKLLWRLWGWGWVARLFLGGRGSPVRELRRSLFGHTLSEGRGCFPRPTGSLTTRVLVDSGSAPPRVSTPSSSSVSRPLGPRIRSYTGSSQQDPAPWLQLAPMATPRRFPIQTRGISIPLTRLLVALHKTPLRPNQSLSLRSVTPSVAN